MCQLETGVAECEPPRKPVILDEMQAGAPIRRRSLAGAQILSGKGIAIFAGKWTIRSLALRIGSHMKSLGLAARTFGRKLLASEIPEMGK